MMHVRSREAIAHLLHIHGSAPEEVRNGVTSVGGLERRQVHEPPRRHRLEHWNVVVSVLGQKTVTSGRSYGRSVGDGNSRLKHGLEQSYGEHEHGSNDTSKNTRAKQKQEKQEQHQAQPPKSIYLHLNIKSKRNSERKLDHQAGIDLSEVSKYH